MIKWVKHLRQSSRSTLKSVLHGVHVKLSAANLVQAKADEGGKTKVLSPDALQSATVQLTSREKQYFVQARSWADDLYTSAVISRNRYKLAFFVAMGLAILLVIAVDGLIPTEHLSPLLVEHYQDGRVSVRPLKQSYAPTHQALVESEIVRYVINRESYDPTSYHTQYLLTALLSNRVVGRQYSQEQSTGHKDSPINVLGNHGFRTVHVDSVIFLDSIQKNKGQPQSKQTHHNLAQVNFTIVDHFNNSSRRRAKAYTALVSWAYWGTPSDPKEKWQDWDGFTVTRYTKQQRNV